MKIILDTSIILLLVKNEKFGIFFEENYQKKFPNDLYYVYVSLGELDAIVKKNTWGKNKIKYLNDILRGLELIPMDNYDFVDSYGTIDAYSQGKLKDRPLPKGLSARNMGKNDIWISAVTLSLKGALITTDKDFDHLHPQIIEVHRIDIQQFK
ncbi:MAG: PIN domain-containing protein [Microscillaceae bacterium]|nr:PIN domain-containing protein [Microscillaceae bacterium]